MICEKCGKINPGKNTVCSSCGSPLPASKSCGGFEDILTINVPVPEAAPAATTISSVSSARTEAAIMKLSTSNEELKKKNSILMISSLGAAGLALIAFIIAIVAAATPSVSPAQFNELESGVVALQSDVDEIGKNADEEKYDDGINALVCKNIDERITDEFKPEWAKICQINDSEITNDSIKAFDYFLSSCDSKLIEDSKKELYSKIFDAITSPESITPAAFEYLSTSCPTIFAYYKNSDEYIAISTILTSVYDEYIDAVTDFEGFKFEFKEEDIDTAKNNYKGLYTELTGKLDTLNTKVNECKSLYYISVEGIDSVTDATAESFLAEYNKNVLKHFTPYTIVIHINDSTKVTLTSKNNETIDIKVYEEQLNYNKDTSTFKGWSFDENQIEEVKFDFTKSANVLFGDNHDDNKTVNLFPVIVSKNDYTVIFVAEDGKIMTEIKKNDPYHLVSTDIPTPTKDGFNFKGWDNVATKEEEKKLSDEFMEGSISTHAGTWKPVLAEIKKATFLGANGEELGNIEKETGDTVLLTELPQVENLSHWENTKTNATIDVSFSLKSFIDIKTIDDLAGTWKAVLKEPENTEENQNKAPADDQTNGVATPQ